MKLFSKKTALAGLALGLTSIGTAEAALIPVAGGEITTTQVWTANNQYRLDGIVYVRNGASIIIEPGTVIIGNNAGFPGAPAAPYGALVITRGSKLYANGTANAPIVFTSIADNGTNRVATGEWGNITLLGNGIISASHDGNTAGTPVVMFQDGAGAPILTNTGTPLGPDPDAGGPLAPIGDHALMEGLTTGFAGDPRVLYGGQNDNDDSGCLSYVSIRYGGFALSADIELNGLALGGIGRETDIHHIDVWNNRDDMIEIWGGTVSLKYLNLWNAGDDDFDLDQGWRGKAQFILIVKGCGLSGTGSSGSGWGDNAIEADGAERSDGQPMTTSTIYNVTVIGQPDRQNGGVTVGADHGVALRDNCRLQIRNAIFMHLGERALVEEASTANTGAWRYGLNGTHAYTLAGANNDVWDMAYTEAYNTANLATGGHPNAGGLSMAQLQALYWAQSQGDVSIQQGFLTEITDSLWHQNPGPGVALPAPANSGAYSNGGGTNDPLIQVTGAAGTSNAAKGNVVDDVNLPIASIARANPVVTSGSLAYDLVTSLDPRAASAAAQNSIASAPIDGFFTPAKYRGAFNSKVNWAVTPGMNSTLGMATAGKIKWTAADQYGIFTGPANPAGPTATVELPVSVVSFFAMSGMNYIVECSADGKNWEPIAKVVGDNALHNINTFVGYDANKVYRVIFE